MACSFLKEYKTRITVCTGFLFVVIGLTLLFVGGERMPTSLTNEERFDPQTNQPYSIEIQGERLSNKIASSPYFHMMIVGIGMNAIVIVVCIFLFMNYVWTACLLACTSRTTSPLPTHVPSTNYNQRQTLSPRPPV